MEIYTVNIKCIRLGNVPYKIEYKKANVLLEPKPVIFKAEFKRIVPVLWHGWFKIAIRTSNRLLAYLVSMITNVTSISCLINALKIPPLLVMPDPLRDFNAVLKCISL